MKKAVLFLLITLASCAKAQTVITRTVLANLDTLVTTTMTTVTSVTLKYVPPVVITTGKPTVFTISAPVTAKTGQIIKGVDITGGKGSGIIIPPGVHDVTVLNSYIHNCATDNGAIYIEKGAYNIIIRNNIIATSGRGVNNVNGSQNIVVVGNYFLNNQSVTGSGAAGGSDVQFNNTLGASQRCDSNLVWHQTSNPAIGDCLSFYESKGTSTSYMSMKYNKVLGGSTYPAGKSAGVVGDVSGQYQDCEYNIAVNSGMEAWQVQGGVNIICSNNVAFGDGSNPVATAAFTYGNYGGVPTNNVTISNNRSNWLNKSKQVSDFWFDPKTVSQPIGWSTNKHDATILSNVLPNPLF